MPAGCDADADALRKAAVVWLQENTHTFQVAGTGIGRALAHILIGMVIGGLLSLEAAIVHTESAPLSSSIANRALRLGLVEYDRRHGWRGARSRGCWPRCRCCGSSA